MSSFFISWKSYIFFIYSPDTYFFYIFKLPLRLCMWLKVGVAMVMTSLGKKNLNGPKQLHRLKACGGGCHICVSVTG